MMLRAPGIFRIAAYLALPFALSPQKGAATSVYLASAPEVASVSGRYFTRSRATHFKTAFNTPEHRNLLWELSARSLRLERTLSPSLLSAGDVQRSAAAGRNE